MHARLRIALTVTLLSTAAACGSSSSDTTTPPPAGTTDWTGTLVGASSTGSLSIVFSSGVPAPPAAAGAPALLAAGTTTVTGTLRTGSTVIPLSGGSYDAVTQALTGLAGGGYTFTGTVTATRITGTFTGPAGATGTFGALPGTTAAVSVYCGSFTNNSDGSNGTWNFILSGSTITGIAFDDPTNVNFAGTATATSMSVTYTVTNGSLTANGSATGTFGGTNNANVSGTWSAILSGTGTVVGSGTFTGSRC